MTSDEESRPGQGKRFGQGGKGNCGGAQTQSALAFTTRLPSNRLSARAEGHSDQKSHLEPPYLIQVLFGLGEILLGDDEKCLKPSASRSSY